MTQAVVNSPIGPVVDELVAASHILALNDVVDGFGHVSVRHPDRDDHFLISRSMAPALVAAEDIMTLELDGNPVDDDRPAFLERFIHAAIYRMRPDVQAVVHSHSHAVIPFGVVASAPLRPVFHMCGFLGQGAPVFEIRDAGGPATDMLIRSLELGQALAARLGQEAAILMRGHGSVVVAPSLRQAVYRAVYLEVNAKLQMQACQLGRVTFLNEDEASNADRVNAAQVDRAWQLWRREVDSQ